MADVNIIIILLKVTQLTLEGDFIGQVVSLRLEFHDAKQSGTSCFPWHVADWPHGAPSPQGPPKIGVTLHASQRVHPGAALQLCWQHKNFPSTKNPLWYLISSWGLPLISGEQAGKEHIVSKHWPKRRNTFSKHCYPKTMKTYFCQQPGQEQMAPKGYESFT